MTPEEVKRFSFQSHLKIPLAFRHSTLCTTVNQSMQLMTTDCVLAVLLSFSSLTAAVPSVRLNPFTLSFVCRLSIKITSILRSRVSPPRFFIRVLYTPLVIHLVSIECSLDSSLNAGIRCEADACFSSKYTQHAHCRAAALVDAPLCERNKAVLFGICLFLCVHFRFYFEPAVGY